jgi:hypothetical protein
MNDLQSRTHTVRPLEVNAPGRTYSSNRSENALNRTTTKRSSL